MVLICSKNRHLAELLISEQLTNNANELHSTADVRLVCHDGCVRVHSAIFSSVSPFLKKLLYDNHDENKSGQTSVILPDFSISVVTKVVQIIYFGVLGIASNSNVKEEVRAIMELLKVFGVNKKPSFSIEMVQPHDPRNEHLSVTFFKRRKGLLVPNNTHTNGRISNATFDVVMQSNTTFNEKKANSPDPELTDTSGTASEAENCTGPQPNEEPIKNSFGKRNAIVFDRKEKIERSPHLDVKVVSHLKSTMQDKSKDKKPVVLAVDSDSEIEQQSAQQRLTSLRRRTARSKGQVKYAETSSSSEDQENESNEYEENESNEDEDEEISAAIGSRKLRSRAGQADAKTRQTKRQPSPTNATSSNNSPKKSPKGIAHVSNTSNSSSDNDDYDSDLDKLDKFIEDAKRCGKCKKKYGHVKDASQCVTDNHKMIRCYFCFKVFHQTEQLFAHYESSHKKASKDKHLECPLCKQSISFKSVSTHVISTHLFDKSKEIAVAKGKGSSVSCIPNPKSRAGRPIKRVQESGTDDDEDNDATLISKDRLVMTKKTSTGDKKVIVRQDKHRN